MRLSNLLWFLPFTSFLTGYFLLSCVHGAKDTTTPALVGIRLQPALIELARHNLNPRIVKEKEDTDLPAGTILSQTPSAGQTIKERQSVFLIVSKQPQYTAPQVVTCTPKEIQEKTHANNLRNKSYYVHSNAPEHTCIGQCPAPEKQVTNKQLITYLSAGNDAPVIVPNFRGQPVPTVLDFLQKHDIAAQLFHQKKVWGDHDCAQCNSC